jgi:ABC-type lipoprotein release transport system permease subunit
MTTLILVIAADRTLCGPFAQQAHELPAGARRARVSAAGAGSPAKVVQPHLPPDARTLHNALMGIAFYAWRASWRRSWRMVLAVTLIGGLLGAAAMAALAGARRTDSAYGRYLQAAKASDVMIDIPGPILAVVREVEALPGKTSAAAWLGLDGDPVINGKVVSGFQTDGLAGSLDGEYFRQDKMTVLAGKLPQLDSADEMAITQPMATAFHLRPGDHMTWQFYQSKIVNGLPTAAPPIAAQRATFLVTAIVSVPPALGDQFDDVDTGILPPGGVARYLNGEWGFGWVAMRLRGGDAGVRALQRELSALADHLNKQYRSVSGVSFNIRILAVAQHEAQQAIEPGAVPLAVLGGLIALAMLIMVGQGLAQMLGRSASDGPILRAMGATRAEAAMTLAAPGSLVIAGSALLAVAGALALSPLAPVGPVRAYDPQTGVRADWLVLGAGALAMLLMLGGLLTWLSWRAAGQGTEPAAARPLAVMTASRRSGLPLTALTGIRYALERGYGRQRAPVRATLAGSVVAVTALAVSLVFSSSLSGLISDPVLYGWNWTTLLQAQGGWGTWLPNSMTSAMAHQPGVTGWSEFGFGQVVINGQEVPVMGVLRELGSVLPPTTSGHAIDAQDQIELGAVTMRTLGVHVGDKVTVTAGSAPKQLTVVGTVTLPSMGTVLTDHVSMGRGALMDDAELLKVQGFAPYTQANAERALGGPGGGVASTSYPSAVAIDATSSAAGIRVAGAVLGQDPDQDPGGMYRLTPQRGAQIIDLHQMGALPLTIALGVALAAVLALALTIAASVRQRRRELALLKSLGMRRGQLRAVVASQTSTILIVAVVLGTPLGIAAGRWAWIAFAGEIGVVPAPVVPAATLAVGVLALLAAGNLLATWPAAVAARTSVARVLRSE